MKKLIISTLLTAGLICSCEKPQTEGPDESCMIFLAANTSETKAPFNGTAPSESQPLDALVCISTDSYSYPSGGNDGTTDGTIGKHLQVQFSSGSRQLINGAYYNKSTPDRTVYFSAMHPQSGWSFADNTSVHCTFDGSDDVMFAPQETGKYGNQNPPTLNFRHLLTWIKMEIKADSEAVATAWGPLRSITIGSKNGISIDLGKAFSKDDVVFDNDVDMKFYKISSPEEVFPDATTGYPMTTASSEVAYVLCAPVIAYEFDPGAAEDEIRIPEYHIRIVSENRDVTIPIDLMNGEGSYAEASTMGKQFTLSLTFMMGNTIAVSTNITDWSTGGIGFGKIEE